MALSSAEQEEDILGTSRLRASGEPILLFTKSPLPRAITFAKIQKTWLIDPSETEESLASVSVTLFCQREEGVHEKKIEGVQLKGGPVSFDELESLMDAVH
jgi:exosome complex RNA-binding protein Rrp42 (RNase PH superfamily)